MYIETGMVDNGLYLVEVFSINHHLMYSKYVYADSFKEAENQIRETLKEL